MDDAFLVQRKAWRCAMVIALFVSIAVLAAAPARSDPAPVTVSAAEIRPIIDAIRLSGSVVAPRSAHVSTAVGGLVARVAVDLGDRVDAGAVLVELDDVLARHTVAEAEAAVEQAEAELADAERRVRIAERLVQRGNMPQNELDARQAQVRIAVAAVERLKADAARERERLTRHTVKAPFAGVVAEKATEAGEWVSPGSAVVELVSVENLWVDIPVPQKYFPQVEAGTPIALQFDALPGRSVAARRVAVVPVNDPVARTFTLRVEPLEDDIPLTPGMSARASLSLATGERDVAVPRDAVIRYPDGRTTVWVAVDGRDKTTVAERQVRLGRSFDGYVRVRQGLAAGERVVVSGNESLRPGQHVRVVGGAS